MPRLTGKRIVFTGLGSLGDLFPILPIARCIASRGHRCTIAVPPVLAVALRSSGFEVRPIGPAHAMSGQRRRESLAAPPGSGAWETTVRSMALPSLDETVDDLVDVATDADLLVTTAWQLAGPIAAEILDIPWVTAGLFPTMFPGELSEPPAGMRTWSEALDHFATAFDPAVNEIRAARGLPARADNVLRGSLSPHLLLVLADALIHPPTMDWPASARQVGYPLWQESDSVALDEEAAAFLSADEPPLLFYLGTAVAQKPDEFWETAACAARATGRRAIMLTAGGVAIEGDDRLLVRKYLPLHLVLDHVAVFVHCGTTGAAYAALRHGTPSVVVPRFFDQPFYADRLEDLGVGVTVPWNELNVAKMSEAIDQVLADRGMHELAEQLGRSFRERPDPAVLAADAIEVLASEAREEKRLEPAAATL